MYRDTRMPRYDEAGIIDPIHLVENRHGGLVVKASAS